MKRFKWSTVLLGGVAGSIIAHHPVTGITLIAVVICMIFEHERGE